MWIVPTPRSGATSQSPFDHPVKLPSQPTTSPLPGSPPGHQRRPRPPSERPLPAHQEDPLRFWADTLHDIGFLAAAAAGVFSIASVFQLGADPVTDSGAAVAAGTADGADEIASQAVKDALRAIKLNRYAVGLGVVAVGSDICEGKLTGHPDYPQIAFDSLSLLPGAAALGTDLRVLCTVDEIDETKGVLATLTEGTEEYDTLETALKALEAGKETTEMVAKALALHSSLASGSASIYSMWLFHPVPHE